MDGKLKIYNGTSWVEIELNASSVGGYTPSELLNYDNLTNAPDKLSIVLRDTVSSETTNTLKEIEIGGDKWKIEGGTGGSVDFYENGYLNVYGMYDKNESGAAIGFNDCQEPTLLNPSGRYICIATDELDGNYLNYEFPERSGTVLLNELDNNEGISFVSTNNGFFNAEGYPGISTDDGTIFVTMSGQMTVDQGYWLTFPEKEGTIALLDDIPKYYIHTIQVTGSNVYLSFQVTHTYSGYLGWSMLYSMLGTNPISCSGVYNGSVVWKLALTNAGGGLRLVYGNNSSATMSGLSMTENIIEVK